MKLADHPTVKAFYDKAAQAPASMGAHNDQVAVMLAGRPVDFRGRIATGQMVLNGHSGRGRNLSPQVLFEAAAIGRRFQLGNRFAIGDVFGPEGLSHV